MLEVHLGSPAEKQPGGRDGYTCTSRDAWGVSPSFGLICVSESVCDADSSSLPFSYAFEVEQRVRNIEEPVRVSRVMPADASGERGASQARPPIESIIAGPKAVQKRQIPPPRRA